ncbi:MAG: glycine cleavage system protein GcvH [Dehalococcoidia bacterium]
MYPSDLQYSKEHEWARVEGNVAVVGVTQYAQDSLGDVVFIDLPDVGSEIEQFSKVGEIESVKAVSDLFSPVGGKVVEVNRSAVDDPEIVNNEPYGAGWLIKVELSDQSQLDGLMDAQAYQALLDEST